MMPAKKLRRYFFWATVIIVLLIVEFFLYHSYMKMTVVANGEALVLRKGSTVKRALAVKSIALKRGDLLDRDGRLVGRGKGGYPVILLNGRRAHLTYKLKQSDKIAVYSGQDLHERVSRKIEVTKPPVDVNGRGSFVAVTRHGVPGLKEVEIGEKSRKVFSEKIIREPSPTIIGRFDKQAPKIALTFDDGPSPLTPQVLAILQEKKVPATFFVVGLQIKKHPEILRRVAEAGYDVGNHTFSHSFLSQATFQEIARELGQNEDLIKKITGKNSHWFRPPGGLFSSLLLDTAAAKGYNFILWSVDPNDWVQSNSALIEGSVVQETRPGSVILLHDGGGNQLGTVLALAGIIDNLRAKGYTFVSLDELYASP